MKVLCFAAAGLLAATATAAGAADEVLAPGDPPLTRSLADRRIEFWEGIVGLRLDDRHRAELRQLQAGEWKRKDAGWKGRWVHLLDVWRDGANGAKAEGLRAGIRLVALDSLYQNDADAVGVWMLARVPVAQAPVPGGGADRPATLTAIELDLLKRRQAEFDLTMQMMSDAQRRHHETMMLIIRNIGPSGRYEYNGATGRYDRWVPYK